MNKMFHDADRVKEDLRSLQDSINRLTRTPKFLVADDDILDSSYLAVELARYFDGNCEILKANNGGEVLTMIKDFSPDAVFLDLKMPVMDGLEVISNLNENKCKVPVIVVTVLPEESHETIQAIKLGAVKIITKPVKPEHLEKIFKII